MPSPLPDTAPLLSVATPAAALFAADMHLDDSQPQSAERFFERLDQHLAQALANVGAAGPPVLFLMGDLFEYWIGDDHEPPVAQALAGEPLYGMVLEAGLPKDFRYARQQPVAQP